VVIATIVNILIFVSVIELIRRNRLKEKYSLLWLFSSLIMLWFSLSRKTLHYVSGLIGIQYPPSFIFLLSFFFLIVINIHFSTVISKLSDRCKTLSQEVAILREMLERDKRFKE
jgi:hypothetical protein